MAFGFGSRREAWNSRLRRVFGWVVGRWKPMTTREAGRGERIWGLDEARTANRCSATPSLVASESCTQESVSSWRGGIEGRWSSA